MQSDGSNGPSGSRRGSKIDLGLNCSSPNALLECAAAPASGSMTLSGVASPALTVSSAPLPDRGYDRSLDLDDPSIQWTAFDVKPGRSGDSRRSSILNPSEMNVHAATSIISEDSRSEFPLRNSSLLSASGCDEELLSGSQSLDVARRLSSCASDLSLLPKLFQPGPLGLTLELNGKVTSVAPNSQGFRAGIQVNWVFKELNGFPFSRELLQVLIKGNKPYQAMFVPSRLAQQLQMRGTSSTAASPVLPRDASRASSNAGSVVNMGSVLSGGGGAASNWEGDTPYCAICESRFNLRLRRHHCRICGRCVCWNCSPHQVKLEGPCQDEGLSRACRTCIDLEGAGRNTEITTALVAATARLRELRKSGGDASLSQSTPATSVGQAAAMVQEAVVGVEELERQRGSRLEKAEALAAERSAEAAAIAELMAKSVDQNQWASDKLVEAVERLGHICPPVVTPGGATSSGANACSPFGPEPKTLVQATNDLEEAIRQLKIRLEARGSGASKKQAIEAGAWENDSGRCSICERRVGKRYLNPRHHCRKCGKCVCGSCSPNMVQLEVEVGPQRLCTACVDAAFAGTKFSKSTTTNEADSPVPS